MLATQAFEVGGMGGAAIGVGDGVGQDLATFESMATGREALRLHVISYTCSQNCMGYRGNAGGCCTLDDRDYIPGPVRDADAFLVDLGRELGGQVSRRDVFIDFEERRALFPDRPSWQEPAN